MAANGGNGRNDVQRRIDLLEKSHLEDRERWRESDKRWRDTHEEIMAILRMLDKHEQAIRKQGERHDALLNIMRRKMES